jgi:hypothetical protein
MSIVKVAHNHVNTNVLPAKGLSLQCLFPVKTHNLKYKVIPAQAGIQKSLLNTTLIVYIDYPLDSRLRGNDALKSEIIKSNLIF